MRIDFNSDLGERFGPWTVGGDAQMLSSEAPANIDCGGHAGDSEAMVRTPPLARDNAGANEVARETRARLRAGGLQSASFTDS